MITVDQKEIIRREYFLNRKSMREIAKDLHHGCATIRKAIYDPRIPTYIRNVPAPKRTIRAFVGVILHWLQEDKRRPTKQQHTAKRIYERLQAEYDYQGSDRTGRREVNRLRGKIPESHVPQTYQPADGGAFDFGEAYVLLGGRETKVHLGYLRLDYSSKYLVVALPTERQHPLFEHHYLPVLLKKPGAFALATPILKWPLPVVYEVYHRQSQKRREGSGGTKEYIRTLMLLKDHPLQQVTAVVEQASGSGLYGYEAVKTCLGEEPVKKLCELAGALP